MSTQRRNVYLFLMAIILATMPCYCFASYILVGRLSTSVTPTPPLLSSVTPFLSLTPIQPTATFAWPTLTPFPTRTPTATLLPTPTQFFPTIVPSPTEPPTTTPTPLPTPTDTPLPTPTFTPILPVDPFATPTPAMFDDI